MIFLNTKRIAEMNEKIDNLLVIIENQNQEIISLKEEVLKLQDKEQQLSTLLNSEVEKLICENSKNTDAIIEQFNINIGQIRQEILQNTGEMQQNLMNLETIINLNSKNTNDEIQRAGENMNILSKNITEEIKKVIQDTEILSQSIIEAIQRVGEDTNIISDKEDKTLDTITKLIACQKGTTAAIFENNEKIDFLDGYLRMLLLNSVIEQLPNNID